MSIYTTPRRFVDDNILVSTQFPDIRVKVNGAFRYIGSFDFTIRNIAEGERYVFAETRGQHIHRLFIAQFESILPESSVTYNYSFENGLMLGDHRFKQNTYAYSNRVTRQENPENEGALTADFLNERGYSLEDELMMSRFVTVPDSERKHELILYYLENASGSGHRLEEFYVNEQETEIWREISRGLTQRSLEIFEVIGSSA